MVRDDFCQLVLDELRLDRLTPEAGQGAGGLVEFALLDEESRGLGKEEETGSEDDSPEQLDCDGDSVRAAVVSVLGGVVDSRRQEQADGDAELVAGDESSTDLSRCDFGHVENQDSRDGTDTETSDKSAGYEEAQSGRGDLENDTN